VSATAPARILITEDNPQGAELLEAFLAETPHEVHVAANGEEALRAVAEWKPDVVLLDVMMPRLSGYDVCRRVRERPELRHIKIVMLTAKGRDAEVTKGLGAGADLYITKPFSTRELVDKVKSLLQ
jgi:DNA-binding response OmpR family regulator